MKPEELKVGMWTTGGWDVARLITRIAGGVVYCREFERKDVEDDSYTDADYVTLGERLATAAEVREHVPKSDQPQWAKDGGPNPHATPAADKSLPWDKPDQLRFVTGEKVEIIGDCRTSGFLSVTSPPAKDAEDFICVVDEVGSMLRTRIPIIRLATAAEMEAERPTPPKPSLHIDLSHYAGKCVAVHFPGMKFDRTEGDDTAVFVRVEGGGE